MRSRELGAGLMRAVLACCGDVAPEDACQRCALAIDTARMLLEVESTQAAPPRTPRIVGYRLAVASREDWSRPPPRAHRDWLRVVHTWDQGLAVERAQSRGLVFGDRAAVEREAERWADAWHTRVIGVTKRVHRA